MTDGCGSKNRNSKMACPIGKWKHGYQRGLPLLFNFEPQPNVFSRSECTPMCFFSPFFLRTLTGLMKRLCMITYAMH